MDTTLALKAQALEDDIVRLQRLGLVVDPAVLSQEHRRIAYTFVRRAASHVEVPAPPESRIGFAYPNAR